MGGGGGKRVQVDTQREATGLRLLTATTQLTALSKSVPTQLGNLERLVKRGLMMEENSLEGAGESVAAVVVVVVVGR